MNPTVATKLVVTANVIVVAIGVVDAAIGTDWDLLLLLVFSLILSLALLFRLEAKRPSIPIRRDLVAWLRDRSAISGEPLATVTDRAVATYRDRYGQAHSTAEEARQ